MDIMLQESNELAAIWSQLMLLIWVLVKLQLALLKKKATFLAKAPQLREDEYVALLNYLQTRHLYYANNYLPYPPNACILLSYTLHPAQVSLGKHTYSCFPHIKAIVQYNFITTSHKLVILASLIKSGSFHWKG
jgi:hypothetical protein